MNDFRKLHLGATRYLGIDRISPQNATSVNSDGQSHFGAGVIDWPNGALTLKSDSMRQSKLQPLEFDIFRAWKKDPPAGKRILVAVSGGRDSVALLKVLARLESRLGLELAVAHVHHGASSNKIQTRYRDRASRHVARIAASIGERPIPFFELRAKVTTELKSEAEFRELRYRLLGKFATQKKFDLIALAHHADDLFETRFMRLMRGTGAHGLEAMTPFRALENGVNLWRPFLAVPGLQLADYLEKNALREKRDWLSDPSNSDVRYLRNALRKTVFPAMEKARKGSTKAFARSLDVLTEALAASPEPAGLSSDEARALIRISIRNQSVREQKIVLSRWLHAQGVSFSKSQIEEAIKRIDTPRRRLTFELCGRVWLLDEKIQLVALSHIGAAQAGPSKA